MADLTLVLPGAPVPTTTHRKATMIGADGTIVTLPIVDPDAELSGLGNRWATIDRPGEKPLTLNGGRKLHKLTVKITCVTAPGLSCEEQIAGIAALENNSPIVLVYGGISTAGWSTETGRWNIVDSTVHVLRRVQGTNDAMQAEITIDLQESNLPPSTSPNVMPKSPTIRTAVVTGDPYLFLLDLAVSQYGKSSMWRKILDANGFRDVRDVTEGVTLVLP